jgi:ribosomal protein L37E
VPGFFFSAASFAALRFQASPGRRDPPWNHRRDFALFPRMSKKPPEQPVTLGGMRALGVRSVYATCSACGYASTVNVDDWQDDVLIESFGPHVKCAKCGHLGGNVRPDWTELRGMPKTRTK